MKRTLVNVGLVAVGIVAFILMLMAFEVKTYAAETTVLAETKETYTFAEVVEEIEFEGLEEEDTELIKSVYKHVDYTSETYVLIVTYTEPTEDGFNWISVRVENGMVEIQARGPETMVAAEYTYRQFMEQ